MNIQLDLEFKKETEKNLFGDNLFDIEIFDNDYQFDFSSCKKSSKVPSYNFTNYFKNRRELYRYVKQEYNKFIRMDFIKYEGILNEYEIKKFGGKRYPLLLEIIRDNTGKKIKWLPNVFRLCNKVNPDLQFYYYESSPNVYKVVAIDIFHLLLPAHDKQRAFVKNDGVYKYNENESNTICLSEILKNE